MAKEKKKLVLIDSNALVHRAFHALPELSKKDGTLTNAVYGYALTLLSVLDRFHPEYIAATFDLKGPTFRHEKYEKYKATRKKAPDELYEQIPMVKDLLRAFNIPIYEKKGFEADDMIGTIVRNPQIDGNVEKIIVTGDLDTLQLVDENTKVFTLRRGITDVVIYDQAKVKERYGLDPRQMIDYKALRGDQSDNIPGVKGIGEKTATELLLKYDNLGGVYENLDLISSESTKKKLREGKESAEMSRDLATIKTDVPIGFNLEDCLYENYDKQKVLDYLQEMEFYSLAKRIGGDKLKKQSQMLGTKIKSTRLAIGEPRRTTQESKLVENGLKIKIINEVEQVDKIINEIRREKMFAFEVLADKDNFYGARVFGIGLYIDQSRNAYFIPEQHLGSLREIFENKEIGKVGFNVKFALELLDDFKMNNFDDVQVQAYLLKAGTATDLEKLVFSQFGRELENRTTKSGQANLLSDNGEGEKKEAAEKAYWIKRLWEEFSAELREISRSQEKIGSKEANLLKIYQELELLLVGILAKMEAAGVRIDKEKLKKVSDEAEGQLGKLEKDIYKQAGREFNINSPLQLAPILYDKLKIPTIEIRKGKTGYSTNADQLRKVRDLHPIIPLIEQYRELFKVKSTYADALPELIQKDERIHANFNQTVAATGRLSSSNPNLQNIPKRGKLAGLIRQAFIAPRGCMLVSADYSQIDLRVAAHLSSDQKMIDIFKQGKDIHRSTAAWVNKIKLDDVSNRQRSEAKSLNFGILYGMGIYGFMRDSGVSRERAEFFIDQYMKNFSGLKDYLEKTKKFAREKGYVETEIGRRRYIQNINSSNYQFRSAAERMAINLPVQGLAADIMKMAMIEADKKILDAREENARLILQIHDELIFEVKSDRVDKFMEEIKKVMEGVYELKVPLIVDVKEGRNWAEL